jgi:hypothetical protein
VGACSAQVQRLQAALKGAQEARQATTVATAATGAAGGSDQAS